MQTVLDQPVQSLHAGTPRMHEMKFALTPTQAIEVEAWLRANLQPVIYTMPVDEPVRVSTLCLDTEKLDVYRRSRGFSGRKFRVRCYGDSGQVHLERKRRSGGRVKVRSVAVPAADLRFLDGVCAEDGWEGTWFKKRLASRQLRPCCVIAYDRLEYIGRDAAEPILAALDRNMRCWKADWYRMDPEGEGTPLGGAPITLEVRYAAFLPTCIRRLIGDLRLTPCCGSKYRHAIEALGLGAEVETDELP